MSLDGLRDAGAFARLRHAQASSRGGGSGGGRVSGEQPILPQLSSPSPPSPPAATGIPSSCGRATSQDGDAHGVFGQRYASGGSALGTEFQVNTYTPSVQGSGSRLRPRRQQRGFRRGVGELRPRTAPPVGVFGQRYASGGSALGTEFQVNTYTPPGSVLRTPAPSPPAATGISSSCGGRSDGQDGDAHGVFGQRYASGGSALGSRVPGQHLHSRFQPVPFPPSPPAATEISSWCGPSSGQDGSFLWPLWPALCQRRQCARYRVPGQHLHPVQPSSTLPSPPAATGISSWCGTAPVRRTAPSTASSASATLATAVHSVPSSR